MGKYVYLLSILLKIFNPETFEYGGLATFVLSILLKIFRVWF